VGRPFSFWPFRPPREGEFLNALKGLINQKLLDLLNQE
jgi:hypothetical protein